jgi:hypothetical protein
LTMKWRQRIRARAVCQTTVISQTARLSAGILLIFGGRHGYVQDFIA